MENIKETFQTTSAGKVKFVRIFVFVVAGMAGLLFGLDQGVISGALPFIAKEWELTSRLQEWVVSSMMVGQSWLRDYPPVSVVKNL